jgi:hypothetical protein
VWLLSNSQVLGDLYRNWLETESGSPSICTLLEASNRIWLRGALAQRHIKGEEAGVCEPMFAVSKDLPT